MNENRWSSRFNFILATTGAAVGLGSIWKFPYMAGDNGGGAFVLVVVIATFLLGIPIMMSEIVLGKIARRNAIGSMQWLAQHYNQSKAWGLLGWWGALALVLVLSFYSVIAGWSIAYIFKTISGEFTGQSAQIVQGIWSNFLSDPKTLMLWHAIFMLSTIWVVARGVQRGLERASQFMMPGLLIVILLLVSYSAIKADFFAGFQFLLAPDFSKLSADVMIDALGQALFSLATGAGCMLVYGCYVPEDTKIAPNVGLIAVLIVLISLLSGLAIFPLVFEHGLSPEGGPGLMFKVLPIVFGQMPGGQWLGGLFFLMLWFAAWTSSISMAEPLVLMLHEQFKLSRKIASLVIGIVCWTVGLLALFSFNVLADVRLFNRYDLFSVTADFATNIILPTGALGFSIFSGWLLPVDIVQKKLGLGAGSIKIWQFLIRYCVPVAIVVNITASFWLG